MTDTLKGRFNIPIKVVQEAKKLEQTARIELWDIDMTKNGGQILRLCNFVNERGGNLVWKGNTYDRYPIQGEGFSFSNEGAATRPRLNIANLMGLVTSTIAQNDLIVGATVIRRIVYGRHLDAANFYNGNAEADTTQEVVQAFVVERITSLTNEAASFELVVPSETTGSKLPNRRVIANLCVWTYGDPDTCGYNRNTSTVWWDDNDNKVNSRVSDVCGKRLTSCRLRHGTDNPLPYGGFPAADKVNR